METRARPCPRCGALNGAGFERCVRCAAPFAPLAAGADLLGSSLDPRKLWGTKVLIALTSLVFFGQCVAMRRAGFSAMLLKGGNMAELVRFGAMPVSLEDVSAEPFRLFSAVFVHFGALHFVMNMMGLANVGRAAEPGIGTARFVVAYVTSGVVGFAINIALDVLLPNAGTVPFLTAGASGAVFGAMGLVIGWLLRRRDRRWRTFAIQAVFFAVLVNLLGMSINNGAHIGGLLCGAAFGFLYAGNPRPKSLLLPNIVAITGLVLSIVSLLLAQRAGNWGKRPFPIDAAIQPGPEIGACACVPPQGAAPSLDGAPLRSLASGPCRADDSAHGVAV